MTPCENKTSIETNKNKLNWSLSAEEISKECETAIKRMNYEIKNITSSHKATFANTAARLDRTISHFNNDTNYLGFYKEVINDGRIKKASQECSEKLESLLIDLFAREDLYEKAKYISNINQKEPVNKALVNSYLYKFKINGLDLNRKKRMQVNKLKQEIILLESEFSENLNNWHKEFEFTKEELSGVPEKILQSFSKAKKIEAAYIVTLQYPHFNAVMRYAKNSEIRKKMYVEFMKRGGKQNKDLLTKALKKRAEIAKISGYDNYAEIIIKNRVAKSPKRVTDFLKKLQASLKNKQQKEIKKLRQLKKQATMTKHLPRLDPWDISYYENILKEKEYQLEDEKIREYFETSNTVNRMLKIYEKLFSVQFIRNSKTKVWHKDVMSYDIYSLNMKNHVGSFFLDLFPRKGKYSHAAAFTLIKAYLNEDGKYEKPISAMLANFNKATNNTPSLLSHREVETLFHEFGHLIHQTLTKAIYGEFSGTSVKRDFVEAPSQMLENWVWDKKILKRLSSHYKTKDPMPDALIDDLIKTRSINVAIKYMRQIFYASVDMAFHTISSEDDIDTSEIWQKLYNKMTTLNLPKETLKEASFNHLMGGYEAGYYGYLWSEVYAQDMFKRFSKEGLLNSKTGKSYRLNILEPGGSKDPSKLIENFLGQKASNKAFLELLGIWE